MPILRDVVYGRPDLGVFLALNDHYFLYPPKINPKTVNLTLKLQPDLIPIETFIAGSAVIGSYVVMNSYGMIIPNIISPEELAFLRGHMKSTFQISEIESEHNAFGNLILANDKGAIISPKLKESCDIISEALKVPAYIYNFAESDLPGSCGLANNHGVVVHPMISEREAERVAEILQVNIDVGTINCGNPYIGGGAIANDHIALFGRESTGPELQRVMEILQLK